MKRKIRVLITVLLMILVAAALSGTAQASAKSKAYKAYRAWIKNGCVGEYGTKEKYKEFCLFKLDSDNVPELIGKKIVNNGISSMCIVSYKKGKLVTQSISEGVGGAGGFRGSAAYIPQKGMIHTASWGSANPSYYDTVIKLTSERFKTVSDGSYDRVFLSGENAKNVVWNKESISKAEYDRKLEELFPKNEGASFEDLTFISKSRMLKRLK